MKNTLRTTLFTLSILMTPMISHGDGRVVPLENEDHICDTRFARLSGVFRTDYSKKFFQIFEYDTGVDDDTSKYPQTSDDQDNYASRVLGCDQSFMHPDNFTTDGTQAKLFADSFQSSGYVPGLYNQALFLAEHGDYKGALEHFNQAMKKGHIYSLLAVGYIKKHGLFGLEKDEFGAYACNELATSIPGPHQMLASEQMEKIQKKSYFSAKQLEICTNGPISLHLVETEQERIAIARHDRRNSYIKNKCQELGRALLSAGAAKLGGILFLSLVAML